MTRPRRYLTRMALFLVITAAGCAMIGASLVQAFQANPWLNGIILGVLLVGILYNFRAVFRLSPEIDWVFGDRGGWGASLLVFVLCPLFGLLAVWLAEQIIRLYRTWRAVSTSVNRRGQLADLLDRRGDLVAMVREVQPDGAT